MDTTWTKFEQTFETLKADILNGKWTCSGSFPSVVAISRRFGIARMTAVKVVEALKRAGLVYAVNGKGTFVSKHRRTLGLIIPALPRAEIFSPICHAFSALCQENDWLLYFADICVETVEKARGRIVALSDKLIDEKPAGVVFHPVDCCTGATEINQKVVSQFQRAGIPVVLLDADLTPDATKTDLDMVGIDNVEVGEMLGRHVRDLGARRVLFVKRTNWSENVRRRYIGLRSVFTDVRGAKVVDYDLSSGTHAAFFRAVHALKPQAVVCSSDFTAAEVLRLLKEMKLRVPADMLVTGVNDVEIARVTEPALTTVRQPCEVIARAAFDLLQWRMAHADEAARHVLVSAALVMRASTDRKA